MSCFWNSKLDFFLLINFKVGKFIFFGGRKNRMKKIICSRRNKLEWEKALNVVEGNFIHELKYQKVEVGGRDYCNDVFCNHKG